MEQHLRVATSAHLDIICLQETRRRGSKSTDVVFDIDGKTITWHVFWTGYKIKSEAGVAICVRKSSRINIVNVQIQCRSLFSMNDEYELKVWRILFQTY